MRNGPTTIAAAASAGSLAFALATAPAAVMPYDDAPSAPAIDELIRAELGLDDGTLFTLDVEASVGKSFSVTVPLGEHRATIDLNPHTIRADTFTLYTTAGGQLVPTNAGPERTLRGTVRGLAGHRVAGSLLSDGLHLRILADDGSSQWLEPVPGTDDGYVIYDADDVHAHGHECGNDTPIVDGDGLPGGMAPGNGGNPVCAELGIDCDFEYFQTYGTVADTLARAESIINTVNLQYESQVNITHEISVAIVRDNPNDPYTESDSFDLLCEFITEWTNDVSDNRDLAHLFTGRDMAGSVIGRASDIGGTGVCVEDGGCSGGTFDTFGSYCVSESDFNGDFGCATDLTAHELGHLWGAFHCFCGNNTMNSGITCANDFTNESIQSINAYRDTRTCVGTCASTEDCPCDFDGSGSVTVDDLLTLLAAWGTSADGDCTGDGQTTVDDLLALLAAWGPCP